MQSAGLRLWLTGDGDTLAAGAAIAPAEFKDPASVKIERAGELQNHLVTCPSSPVSIMLCNNHNNIVVALPKTLGSCCLHCK